MVKKIISCAAAAVVACAAFAANPLITKEGYLNVSFTTAQMQQYAADAQVYMNGEIEKILQVPAGQKTFDNTIAAFERALGEYHDRTQFLSLGAHILTDAQQRKTALDIGAAVKKYRLDIFTKKDLYAALAQAAKSLKGKEDYVAKKVLVEFEKNGMSLDDKNLKKFISLKKQLIDLETSYDEVLSASKASITLKPSELAGLSSTMIASMARDKAGNYVLDITPRSTYFAFLASSELDEKRKEAEKNYQELGGKKNLDTLDKMLKIRQEIAKMFGFENASDYILQDKMARNYDTAAAFSADLVSKMQIKAAYENDEFLKIKRALTKKPAAIALTDWDWRFYSDKYKKRQLSIDDEKIKEYFPTDYVTDKMLNLFGNLFGVKFERVDIPVWHKDVMPYAVKENDKVVGYIYMDTVPREGKYTHAECDDVIIYRENPDGTRQIPVAVLVSNAAPAAGGIPSLLSTTELGTLFHEFGHGINFLFNRAPYSGLTSSLVWDFVEVPSKQM
ncbi:MAG: M3 family metallopeptidase, partial [Elusimicrobiota bacterium]|nr:M3 family metallopeptidase [Elusimicrobiota bacterium]